MPILTANVTFTNSTGDNVTIGAKVDDPASKTVSCNLLFSGSSALAGNSMNLTLWSGAAYDAIGDWTEAQADAQVLALLGQTTS